MRCEILRPFFAAIALGASSIALHMRKSGRNISVEATPTNDQAFGGIR